MNYSESLLDVQALVARYDDNGKLYTILVKKSSLQKSNCRPIQLIDNQLRKNGSSLRGAKDSAASILGTTSMHPFLMQIYPDLHVWFPAESLRNETCAYFCLHQIQDYDAYLGSKTSTIVYLYGDFAVVVPVSKSKFEGRMREADAFISKAYAHRTFTFDVDSPKQKQILKCAEMRSNYLV